MRRLVDKISNTKCNSKASNYASTRNSFSEKKSPSGRFSQNRWACTYNEYYYI